MNRDEGLQALKDSIKAIEDVITNKNGTFVIQQAVSFCQYCILGSLTIQALLHIVVLQFFFVIELTLTYFTMFLACFYSQGW